MTETDRASLREACGRLEYPGLVARLTAMIGRPMEDGMKRLPAGWSDQVQGAAERAIGTSLDVALKSLPPRSREGSDSDELHRFLGMGSGAIGGFFGLPGTLLELPVSTTLMLRSIADIARAEGEDLARTEARLACVEVFAYGANPAEDDAAESGYYGLRIALGLRLSVTSRQLVGQGLSQHAVPGAIGFVRAIASRFGVVVSDKLAFQLVPVAGAISGAVINAVFMRHFQDVARGHFTVRRLERTYGAAAVRRAYERVRLE